LSATVGSVKLSIATSLTIIFYFKRRESYYIRVEMM
jgi:hypothetical protein